MQMGRVLCAVGIVILMCFGSAAAMDTECRSSHKWSYIAYPGVPLESPNVQSMEPRIERLNDRQFCFVLYRQISSSRAEKAPSLSAFDVRLHSASGGIQRPLPDRRPFTPVAVGGALAAFVRYEYEFKWGQNVLDEGWFELRDGLKTYWFEIPYGFARDPDEALSSESTIGGVPTSPRHMKECDTLVRWEYVHYELGEIQNGWDLSINLSNSTQKVEAEAILYKDTAVGKPGWQLDSPRTGMKIRATGLRTRTGKCMEIRLHEDWMRRSDTIVFFNPQVDLVTDERTWGTATVTVDEEKIEFILPSSLFKFRHGTIHQANQ